MGHGLTHPQSPLPTLPPPRLPRVRRHQLPVVPQGDRLQDHAVVPQLGLRLVLPQTVLILWPEGELPCRGVYADKLVLLLDAKQDLHQQCLNLPDCGQLLLLGHQEVTVGQRLYQQAAGDDQFCYAADQPVPVGHHLAL